MWSDYFQIWVVRLREGTNVVWIGSGLDREDAKRAAQRYIGGKPDEYVVTPITEPKDRIRIEMTIAT